MQWYLLVLILLLGYIHFQVAAKQVEKVPSSKKEENLNSPAARRQFQEEMLKAHNLRRARHCVPPLSLDGTLSHSAQSHADHLAATDTFEHSHSETLGENLYMSSSSNKIKTVHGTDATDAWYNEVKDYNFQAAQFSSGTGHFTQVVWKDSKTLGAGFALTADGRTAYVVAQYSPAGNYQGEFQANVFPQKEKC